MSRQDRFFWALAAGLFAGLAACLAWDGEPLAAGWSAIFAGITLFMATWR